MKFKTSELQTVCADILLAVDSSVLSDVADAIQINVVDNKLTLTVTNGNYYVSTAIDASSMFTDAQLFATVKATTFLKLISKITTPELDLSIVDKALVVSANGTYNFPILYDGDSILKLPAIDLTNTVETFSVNSSVLQSILKYNSTELSKVEEAVAKSKPIYRLYYIDSCGALTLSSGACVNNFSLGMKSKLLLPDKIVKLFKLFNSNENINVSISQEAFTDSIMQTKVKFESATTILVAKVQNNDKLLSAVPTTAIRNLANDDYDYSAIVDKSALLSAINRLLIFVDNRITTFASKFEFFSDHVVIYNSDNVNFEVVPYTNSIPALSESSYSCKINLSYVKSTLESCNDIIHLDFGRDKKCILIVDNTVIDVISLLRE